MNLFFVLVALLILATSECLARSLIPVPPPGQMYFGGYNGVAWYKPDAQSAMSALENTVGRKMDVDRIYHIFNEFFPQPYHKWTVSQGRIPLISLMPKTVTNGVSKVIPWADITAGKQDAYLKSLAKNIKDWGVRIFFCFHHEPDLNFICPGNTLSGCDLTRYYGTTSQFVSAYRHIRTLWDKEGVSTVTYMWIATQMNWGNNPALASSYYPGASVVDWIGLDMYNFISSSESFNNWASFNSMVRDWYKWASKTGLPLILAEWGCREYRPDPRNSATWKTDAKAEWFKNILSTLASETPAIKALVYFNVDQNPRDWRVESSTKSLSGFNSLAHHSMSNWWRTGAGLSMPKTVSYNINFQTSDTPVPGGYFPDFGGVYRGRNGISYGWTPDASSTARRRNHALSPNVLHDTLVHMQLNGASYKWEIALPVGTYTVKLTAGDPSYTPMCLAISMEDKLTLSGCTTMEKRWLTWVGNVYVSDGRLTVANMPGHSSANKINFIQIATATGTVASSIKASRKRDDNSPSSAVSEDNFLDALAAASGEPRDRFQLLGSSAHGHDQSFRYMIMDNHEFVIREPSAEVAKKLSDIDVDGVSFHSSVEHAYALTPPSEAINPPPSWISRYQSKILVAMVCALGVACFSLAGVVVYLVRRRKREAELPSITVSAPTSPTPSSGDVNNTGIPLPNWTDGRTNSSSNLLGSPSVQNA